MDKIYAKEKLKKLLKTLLIELHSVKCDGISFPCRSDAIWSINIKKYQGSILNPKFQKLRILKLNGEDYLVTGRYTITHTCVPQYKFTLIISNKEIVYMQDAICQNVRIYTIIASDKTIYQIKENEIIYIESQHNHIVWHCVNEEIISNDSLKRIQENLSEEYIRIHRCYIVNRKHVKKVCRCEAHMSNGDAIPIPYKKYVETRERLI